MEKLDVRFVHVTMERVDPDGLTTIKFWTIEEDERISALLAETWGKGWESHGYRLAYGLLKGILTPPIELEWESTGLSKHYDPTLRELFVNVNFRRNEGEDYYLLISKLDTSRLDDLWVQRAVERFALIYPEVAHASARQGDQGVAHPP